MTDLSDIFDAPIKMTLGLKNCTTCLFMKSLADFNRDLRGVGGRTSRCRGCAAVLGKAYRAERSSGLLFRVNRAILKRQSYNTSVCWLEDAPAHKLSAHLLGPFGLMDAETASEFRSIFELNLPQRLSRLEQVADELAVKRAELVAKRAAAQAEKAAAKLAENLAKCRTPREFEITDALIDDLLYQRLRHHLKKRRRLSLTVQSFTKQTFDAMTGYTSSQLRTHLSEQMPDGKTWADVVSCQLHIEHIMPAAAFDLTTTGSIRRCYALSNLTLLCANKNASKGATTDKATVRHFRADPELARLFGLVE